MELHLEKYKTKDINIPNDALTIVNHLWGKERIESYSRDVVHLGKLQVVVTLSLYRLQKIHWRGGERGQCFKTLMSAIDSATFKKSCMPSSVM